MANNVSTLGQQINLISRVKSIQAQMSTYQQQISTGLKYQTFKDYGADSMRIQRYRSDLVDIEGFVYNIDIAQVNIEQMDTALNETIEQAGNVLSAINIQLAKGSEFDIETIKQVAATALQLVEANMNAKIGDRYLFTGTDVSNKPYVSPGVVTTNVQTRLEDWLDGTVNTSTFLNNVKTMTDNQLGYSGTLGSAKNIYARADVTFDVDYTVLANNDGFKNIVAGLNVLANMEMPVEGTDVPTKDDFHTALNDIYKFVQDGVQNLRNSQAKTASAAGALQTMRDNHLNDRQTLQKILENTESADVTDAAVKFQALQGQLEASYRVTAILSQLSLSRFLGT
ncbi:MAG TPA: hypothetical protein VIN59_09535 [Alphaproteobacteria bacterium]